MRAPEIWAAMVEAMENDAVIQGVMSGAIYLSDGERAHEVPSLTGTFIGASQGERFVTASWQLDAYARTMQDAVAVGEALLGLFDHDVRTVIGGMRMWARCTDEREFHGPVGDGVYRRSLDIEAEVIRRRYVRAGAQS